MATQEEINALPYSAEVKDALEANLPSPAAAPYIGHAGTPPADVVKAVLAESERDAVEANLPSPAAVARAVHGGYLGTPPADVVKAVLAEIERDAVEANLPSPAAVARAVHGGYAGTPPADVLKAAGVITPRHILLKPATRKAPETGHDGP